MSESIFEAFTDERGNISVRVSQEVQVFTREEADRIEAEYKRMKAENAKLREAVKRMHKHIRQTCRECDGWYCCATAGTAPTLTKTTSAASLTRSCASLEF